MSISPEFPLTVFFDGGCGVCCSEMRTYRMREHGGRLIFIDIRSPRFNPESYGLAREEFMAQLHAIDSAGHVYRGIEAFRAIWKAFPGSRRYGFLDTVLSYRLFNHLTRLLYQGVARIRGHLPRM